MTLPASFPLSMSQVATELGLSLPLSLSHAWIQALAGVSGLPLSLSQLLGKTGRYDGSNTISSGPVYSINLNNPFFGGTLNILSQQGTGNLTLAFSSAPNWSGNINVINNSSGANVVLAKQNSTTWFLAGASANILINRAGNTDSFTILPSN